MGCKLWPSLPCSPYHWGSPWKWDRIGTIVGDCVAKGLRWPKQRVCTKIIIQNKSLQFSMRLLCIHGTPSKLGFLFRGTERSTLKTTGLGHPEKQFHFDYGNEILLLSLIYLCFSSSHLFRYLPSNGNKNLFMAVLDFQWFCY